MMNLWLPLVISALLGVLAVFAGVHLKKFKQILKEISELVVVLSHSLQDNKITADEMKKIVKEATDVIEAFKKK